MGLLGKIQNKTRNVIADTLKRGREHEGSINNKLKRIASNMERHDKLAANAIKGIIKFNELAEMPFRKMNSYLYDKVKPLTPNENTKPDNNDSADRAQHIRKLLNAKRMTPTESFILNERDNKNEI